MEQCINKVEVLGRIGADPRVSQTEEGRKVIRFNVATSEYFKTFNGEVREETTWHRVVAWENKDMNQFHQLLKGTRVHLTGRIRVTTYEKEGQQRYSQEIVAQSLEVVS